MAKTVHVDLGPLGFEDQWFDIRDPKYMSDRRAKKYAVSMQGSDVDPKVTEDFLRNLVFAWHVLDADSEEPLDDPTTADLGGLPLGVSAAISGKFNELITDIVPNALRKS